MKTFNLKKDSWHWWIATTFGGHETYDTESNICSYSRRVVLGSLLFALAVFICLGLTASVGDLLAWVIVGLQHGFLANLGLGMWAGLLLSGIAVLAAGACVVAGINMYGYKAKQFVNAPKEISPGLYKDRFHVIWWRSFKDKTCAHINIS